MTSTKTYYFTTVLRTILTEQKADGPGDKPAFNDIASFDDFWTVSYSIEQDRIIVFHCHLCLGNRWSCYQWSIQSKMVQ
jgi:hypothetical protein